METIWSGWRAAGQPANHHRQLGRAGAVFPLELSSMPVDNRSFVAKYSRILRKKLSSKLIVDFVVRRTLAPFGPARRHFHLYLRTASPEDVPHKRVDPGAPVSVSVPIDARMQAHLQRYTHGLEGCLAPGRLTLSTDVRVYELRDCALLPWLGVTLYRPTEQVIAGGVDAQPRVAARTRAIEGLVCSLLDSPRGHNHYFHFFEHLTLLMRALSWQDPATPISLLVRERLSSFQTATIEALLRRRPNLTLVRIAEDEVVAPERLLLIKRQPGPIICWFALIEEWREIGAMMREAYGPAPPPFDRKAHLTRSRQKVRRLLNEDALAPVFEKYGFETIAPETLSHAEQVRLMMQCREVASVEGAAVTNIIFCDKPIRLILMDPREILNPFWEGLTLQLGHDFDYVESGPAGWFDGFEVQPEALEAALGRVV
jgi:hypothetical protein